jgi:hypothetical protein
MTAGQMTERLKAINAQIEAWYWRFTRCAPPGKWPAHLYAERATLERLLKVPK